MTERTIIFDRHLVRRRRSRAARDFRSHDFLVRETAQEVADRLSAIDRQFAVAVDLSCHSGIFSEILFDAERDRKVGLLIESDLSPRMLSRHRPAFVGDEEYLAVKAESVDLISSLMTLHWVNDLPGALVQIRRALKPDGLFMAALLGGDTLVELRTVLAQAETEIEGGMSPHISPMADLREMGALLQRAGFALPVADADTLTVTYTSVLALMTELRGMAQSNALIQRRCVPMKRATLLRATELYAERFSDAEGRIKATFQIIYLAGWAPHEAQQKPLPPGSAKMRLADALNTSEQSTGEKAKPKGSRGS